MNAIQQIESKIQDAERIVEAARNHLAARESQLAEATANYSAAALRHGETGTQATRSALIAARCEVDAATATVAAADAKASMAMQALDPLRAELARVVEADRQAEAERERGAQIVAASLPTYRAETSDAYGRILDAWAAIRQACADIDHAYVASTKAASAAGVTPLHEDRLVCELMRLMAERDPSSAHGLLAILMSGTRLPHHYVCGRDSAPSVLRAIELGVLTRLDPGPRVEDESAVRELATICDAPKIADGISAIMVERGEARRAEFGVACEDTQSPTPTDGAGLVGFVRRFADEMLGR